MKVKITNCKMKQGGLIINGMLVTNEGAYIREGTLLSLLDFVNANNYELLHISDVVVEKNTEEVE